MDGIGNTTSRIWRHVKGALMPDGTNVMYFWSATNDRVPDYKQLLWVTYDGGLSFELRSTVPKGFEHIIPHPYFPGVALLLQNSGIPSRVQLWKTEDAGITFKRIFYPLINSARTYWAPNPDHPLRIIAGATLGITSASSRYWNNKVLVTDNFFSDYRILLEHVADFRVQMINSGTPTSDFAPYPSQSPTPPSGNRVNNTLFSQTWPSYPTPSTLSVWSSNYHNTFFSRYDVVMATDPNPHLESEPGQWKNLEFASNGYVDPYMFGWGLNYLEESVSYITGNRDRDYTVYKADPRMLAQNESITIMPRYKDGTLNLFPNLPGTLLSDQYVMEKEATTNKYFSYRSTNGGSLFSKIPAPGPQHGNSSFLVFAGVANTSPLLYGVVESLGSLFATATVVNASTPLPLVYNRTHRPEVSTYFTSDGGGSWQELGIGYQIPEYAARGALAAYATLAPTNELVYSLDDGQSWRTIVFSTENLRVQNIRVASDYNSRSLLILAQSIRTSSDDPSFPPLYEPVFSHPPEHVQVPSPAFNDSAPEEPIIEGSPDLFEIKVPFNFSQGENNHSVPYDPSPSNDDPMAPSEEPTSPPTSTTTSLPVYHLITVNFDDSYPICSSSDYELWSPLDHEGQVQCLLGERLTFHRRKRGHFCFPQPPTSSNQQSQYPWPHIVNRESCECDLHDYECGPCFERTTLEDGAQCRFICGSESRSFVESRFPTLPYQQFYQFCTAPTANSTEPIQTRYFKWTGSAGVAFQKISQSKCKSTSSQPIRLEDAIIPCRYRPPTAASNTPTNKRSPFITAEHLKLIILMSVSTTTMLSLTFCLLNIRSFLYYIISITDRSPSNAELFDAANFDLELDIDDEDEDAVEMQEVAPIQVAETTTSSDEENHSLVDSDEEDEV